MSQQKKGLSLDYFAPCTLACLWVGCWRKQCVGPFLEDIFAAAWRRARVEDIWGRVQVTFVCTCVCVCVYLCGCPPFYRATDVDEEMCVCCYGLLYVNKTFLAYMDVCRHPCGDDSQSDVFFRLSSGFCSPSCKALFTELKNPRARSISYI